MNPTKNFHHLLQLIAQKDKTRNKKSTPQAFKTFTSRFDRGIKLVDNITRAKASSFLQREAVKNLIVSFVISIEAYLKEVILERAGEWSKEGFDELLKEKISLAEAMNLFKLSETVHKSLPEYLVVHTYSFQNFDTINKVFSALLNVDFFRTIENYRLFKDNDNKNGIFSFKEFGGNRVFIALLGLRNNVIHEGLLPNLTKQQLAIYRSATMIFAVAVSEYINERLPELRRKSAAKKL